MSDNWIILSFITFLLCMFAMAAASMYYHEQNKLQLMGLCVSDKDSYYQCHKTIME